MRQLPEQDRQQLVAVQCHAEFCKWPRRCSHIEKRRAQERDAERRSPEAGVHLLIGVAGVCDVLGIYEGSDSELIIQQVPQAARKWLLRSSMDDEHIVGPCRNICTAARR